MSTYMAKNETIERKWYILDAAGKPLGRTAALAASLLKGKHKVEYTPHVDCGDYVIIINAGKAVLTGNKLIDKYYRTHSGYVGGLKETQYKTKDVYTEKGLFLRHRQKKELHRPRPSDPRRHRRHHHQ